MKSTAKTAIATLGGAAALVLAAGFGGVAISPAPAQPAPAAPAASSAVHTATLTGCIDGANC